MGKKKNIWKRLNLHPSRSSHDLSSPSGSGVSPGPSAQYKRVPTSREVRKAYNARQNARATVSGTYVLSRGRRSLSEPDLSLDAHAESSTSRAVSPTSAFQDYLTASRSSSPPLPSPTKATGWSSDYATPQDPTEEHAHYKTTRANQWTKWTTVVIPSLVQHYFALCRRTNNLASVDREFAIPCACTQALGRSLKVTCVYFDRMLLTLPFYS